MISNSLLTIVSQRRVAGNRYQSAIMVPYRPKFFIDLIGGNSFDNRSVQDFFLFRRLIHTVTLQMSEYIIGDLARIFGFSGEGTGIKVCQYFFFTPRHLLIGKTILYCLPQSPVEKVQTVMPFSVLGLGSNSTMSDTLDDISGAIGGTRKGGLLFFLQPL